MTPDSSLLISRRGLLRAGGAIIVAAGSRPAWAAASTDYQLAPAPSRATFLGPKHGATAVWAYNGQIPGPVLRARQGETMRIVLENKLDQDTTVHWHGIRLPNAMDGVPGLTQPPVKPGERFTYEFTPPDAGTFWYHPHANSLQQLGHGLAGALIVEEPEPVAVDREILWVLSDWRLRPNGEIAAGFGNMMDAGMGGRVGNMVTLNGAAPTDLRVRAGERIRLRLMNAALARIMTLRFEGHRLAIVAIDGQPCEPHEPADNRVLLGPAMRVDLMIDMQGDPGGRYLVTDDFYRDLGYTLTRFSYSNDAPVRSHASDAPLRLPQNPMPEPDISSAERHDIVLQGGMMGGGAMMGMGGMNGMVMPGMVGGAVWAINGMSMTGDGHKDMQPLLTLQRGKSYVLRMHNQTAWWHPMHLHGHSFRVVSRNGEAVPYHQWSDTVLIPPRETVDCAFVADNPGDWMLHCHVMDHQVSGLMTVLRVA